MAHYLVSTELIDERKKEIFFVLTVNFVILQPIINILFYKNTVVSFLNNLKYYIAGIYRRKIMIDGGSVSGSVTAESHFPSIDYKQEVQGVDQCAFSDIIRSHYLQGIAVIEILFGFIL